MADALARSASTRSAVQAVCLSVSGVNHPTDQHRILNWLRFDSKNCILPWDIICSLLLLDPARHFTSEFSKGLT